VPAWWRGFWAFKVTIYDLKYGTGLQISAVFRLAMIIPISGSLIFVPSVASIALRSQNRRA
jgi:hypothetical protein